MVTTNLGLFNNTAWAINPFHVRCMETIIQTFALEKFIGQAENLDMNFEEPLIKKETLIFPIKGTLIPKTDDWDKFLGFVSTLDLMYSFKDLVLKNQSSLKRIILYMDTPGGSTIGMDEFGALIHEVATQSGIEVITFTDNILTSAGYYFASASNKIYALPTAIVGCIGIIILSIKHKGNSFYEFISYAKGDLKAAGSPEKQIDMKEMKFFIDWVERDYDQMVDDIAKFRNVSKEEVENTQSRFYPAKLEPWFVDDISIHDINDLII